MKLLEGEKEIASLGDDVFLTNYRIVKEKNYHSHNVYIFLDKISGIEAHYKENFNLVIYGAFLIVTGVVLGNYYDTIGYLPVLLGIILVGRYIRTREHIVSFATAGSVNLEIIVTKSSYKHINSFNQKVQNEMIKLRHSS